MSVYGCVLLGDRGGWRVEEADVAALADLASVDDVIELLRNFDEPLRVLLIEQDDEYAAVVRLDVAAEDEDAPTVFLSNGHAADDYPLAALLADGLPEVGGDPLGEDGLLDGDPLPTHDAAPFGYPGVLADLGMPAEELVELANHESTLPIDLIEAVCERLGCLDEFEAVRA
jgi:putative tRNA adenosine deaminase-associated protein